MPKAKVERILSDDGQWATVEVEVGERGKSKTAQYRRPSLNTFKSLLSNGNVPLNTKDFYPTLSDKITPQDGETVEAFLHRMLLVSIDRLARAAVYESLAQESTIITVGKEKVDIMSFPVKRLIRAFNGMRERVETSVTVTAADAFAPDGTVKTDAASQQKYQTAVAAAEKSIGFGPWKTAARNLTEGYKDDNGKDVAPQATMSEDGLLAPLAA